MSAAFQLIAGSLPLDFTNTLDNRGLGPEREQELLASYADLVAFAQQSGAIPASLARKLNARATHEPGRAEEVVVRALAVRECIYRVVSAIANGATAQAADLDAVNAEVAASASNTRLQRAGATFAWTWSGAEDALERVLWPIMRATADLLTSENLERVRLCDDEKCRWAFLDTSRNRSRRWCDMKVCGNRAKVRRFHARTKRAT